ncbi:uncharacterized protein LOC117410388 isoform X2 [Acipenser ruthenus]|uniref:uncharacterized protein LOC117410388 isoform X2 n=1 Tax=Acipenser ruthenus TaxID=7906 RepID=UPI00274096D1|nr:uncharacterized protein LOC117410388 isoform X2 [Acipenser ruthenus]
MEAAISAVHCSFTDSRHFKHNCQSPMPSPVESLYSGYTVNMACCWHTLGVLLCVAVLAVYTQMLGGLQDVSTDREDVQRAARFAVAEYNKASNHPYSSKMIRIVSAQVQFACFNRWLLDLNFTCIFRWDALHMAVIMRNSHADLWSWRFSGKT